MGDPMWRSLIVLYPICLLGGKWVFFSLIDNIRFKYYCQNIGLQFVVKVLHKVNRKKTFSLYEMILK